MEGTIGEIRLFAGNFAPRNWAYCAAQLVAIRANTALFSILGTTYGGDGQTTFGLPDLRGRVPISQGQGPGLPDYVLGELAGTETNTMTIANMPVHVHGINFTGKASTNPGTQANPTATVNTLGAIADVSGGGNPANAAYNSTAPTIQLNVGPQGSTSTGVTGMNVPFNNMQPYLALNYIICLTGVFPARN